MQKIKKFILFNFAPELAEPVGEEFVQFVQWYPQQQQ
jgi:hypothetical protein